MSNKALPIIASISAIALTSLVFQKLCKYGLEGTLRYIWIGDHLTPNVRESTDILEKIATKRVPKVLRKMHEIEIMISTAALNSVDDGYAQNEVNENGNRCDFYSNVPTLQQDLCMLSYILDHLATDIDSVESYGNSTVRAKKKELSLVVVDLMKTVDGWIKSCGFDGKQT